MTVLQKSRNSRIGIPDGSNVDRQFSAIAWVSTRFNKVSGFVLKVTSHLYAKTVVFKLNIFYFKDVVDRGGLQFIHDIFLNHREEVDLGNH